MIVSSSKCARICRPACGQHCICSTYGAVASWRLVTSISPLDLKDSHLRRRTDFLVFWPHRDKPHRVAESPGNTIRPILKLLPPPPEAMAGMAKAAFFKLYLLTL